MSQPSDDEIRDELDHHIASRAERNQSAGQPPDDALAAARRTFGNRARIHEDTRAIHVNSWLDVLRQDASYAWQTFVRRPAVPVTAVIVFALGIGPAVAVFSVVDRILFRPLPYPAEHELVSVGLSAPIEPGEFMLGPDYAEWRREQTPFAAITSWSGTSECDLTAAQAIRLLCGRVEASFLPTLGIAPARGRNFTTEEDRLGAPRVVLLSHDLWRDRFGSDESILDRTITLDGATARVVGILPPSFELPTLNRFDLLYPQQLRETIDPNGGMELIRSFARLKPGVTIAQASRAMAPLLESALKRVPAAFRKEVGLGIRPLRERQTGDALRASWILLAAVGAVLLIASANIANLLLARMSGRAGELAMRAALGASRARLARQLVTEGLLLSAAGGALGVALAYVLLRIFVTIAPAGIPRLEQASIDPRVLVFTLIVATVTGLAASLVPALQLPRTPAPPSQRTVTGTRGYLRYGMLAAQVAASVILLTGASVLLRSLWRMQAEPLGFDASQVIAVPVTLPRGAYNEPVRRAAFFERLEQIALSIPGASAVALADTIPPSGRVAAMIASLIEVEGRPRMPEGTGGMVPWRTVTPGFFRALSIPLVQGRAFEEQDREPGNDAVILGEGLARRLFGEQEPLGKKLRFGARGGWHTVVGIAAGVNNNGFAPADPEYYLPRKHVRGPLDAQAREGTRSATLVIRSPLTPQVTERWLQSEVARLDASIPIAAEPLRGKVDNLTARPRFNALLLSLFAAIGLLLGAVGLYGVVSLLVGERTREMGIRLALGATRRSVTALIMSRALAWCAAGAAAGLAGSWSASRLIESLLYKTPPRDPAGWAAACATLLAVTATAAWIPARRAGRVNPATVLRGE